ncbi:MAG TPA: AI-2E family transporter, partial [Thermodesulfobacteriota bacterium]
VTALAKQLPEFYRQAAAIVDDLRRISRTQLPPQWRRTIEGYLGQIGTFAIDFLQGSIGAIFGFVASVLAIVLVPILTWFMLQAAPGVRGSILAWFPPRLKPEVDFLLAEVNLVMLKFLRGRLIVAGAVGVAIGLGTFALGVPYPLVLGLAAGLLDLIPFVGPVLAAVPAVALTLFDDPGRALLVVALYVAVQQLEQLVLSPKIEGGELKLNPAVVIVAATAAGTLFGILGVLLAVPITALVRIGLLYLRAKLRGEPLESVGDHADG